MKVSVKSTLALSLAALLMSTAASASDRGESEVGKFNDVDREVMRQQWFDRVDTNNDGYISEQEFVDRVILRAERRARSSFQRMDRHNKGELSFAELTELAEQRKQRGAREARHQGRSKYRYHQR